MKSFTKLRYDVTIKNIVMKRSKILVFKTGIFLRFILMYWSSPSKNQPNRFSCIYVIEYRTLIQTTLNLYIKYLYDVRFLWLSRPCMFRDFINRSHLHCMLYKKEVGKSPFTLLYLSSWSQGLCKELINKVGNVARRQFSYLIKTINPVQRSRTLFITTRMQSPSLQPLGHDSLKVSSP